MAQEALAPVHECSGPSTGFSEPLGHLWKPEPLSWPERPKFQETKVDDLDRHISARVRFVRLVAELAAVKRREFPARTYCAVGDDGSRERTRLLRDFGGLPAGTEWDRLNGVPAATLEKAVEQFAEAFGLGKGASGNLAATASTPSMLDPTPRFRDEEAAPW